jgi:hypothetical protein
MLSDVTSSVTEILPSKPPTISSLDKHEGTVTLENHVPATFENPVQTFGVEVPPKNITLLVTDWASALAFHCADGHTSLEKICLGSGVPFVINNVKLRCNACSAVNPKAMPKTKVKNAAAANLKALVDSKIPPLGVVFLDLVTFPVKARDGTRYGMVIVDQTTRKVWGPRIPLKSSSLRRFLLWGAAVRAEKPHLALGVVRSDNEFL